MPWLLNWNLHRFCNLDIEQPIAFSHKITDKKLTKNKMYYMKIKKPCCFQSWKFKRRQIKICRPCGAEHATMVDKLCLVRFSFTDKPSAEVHGTTILDTVEFAILWLHIAPEGCCSLSEWFEILSLRIAFSSHFLLLPTFTDAPHPLQTARSCADADTHQFSRNPKSICVSKESQGSLYIIYIFIYNSNVI